MVLEVAYIVLSVQTSFSIVRKYFFQKNMASISAVFTLFTLTSFSACITSFFSVLTFLQWHQFTILKYILTSFWHCFRHVVAYIYFWNCFGSIYIVFGTGDIWFAVYKSFWDSWGKILQCPIFSRKYWFSILQSFYTIILLSLSGCMYFCRSIFPNISENISRTASKQTPFSSFFIGI